VPHWIIQGLLPKLGKVESYIHTDFLKKEPTMNIKVTAFLTSSTVFLATVATLPAHAAGLTFATSVDSYTKGEATGVVGKVAGKNVIGIVDIDGGRDNVSEALGAPVFPSDKEVYDSKNDKFLSLGLGGEAIFSFGTLFRNEVRLWETTWGAKSKQSDYDEQVDVYAQTVSGDWEFVRRVRNIADNAYNDKAGTKLTLAAGKIYQKLKLVDQSAKFDNKNNLLNGRDGWDVAAIAVEGVPTQAAAVPEPTTMAGLAMAGSGLLAARRRRQAG
jgi:hypothetical protein